MMVAYLLNPSALFTLHVTVTAPTATKHVAIPKALDAIKEGLRSALDTADMFTNTRRGKL
jgi:ribosomal protein S9